MRSNRFTQIALVGAAIAIAACAKEQSNTTTDSAGGAMNANDSSAMKNGSNNGSMNAANNGTGGAASGSSANGGSNANGGSGSGIATSDASIMAYLDQVNMADSAGGKLASTKGTSSAVRDFGKMMVTDHHQMRVQGQALVKKDSLNLTAASGDTTQQHAQHTQETLNSMAKGNAWDAAYISDQVAMHQSVLDNAQAASNQTQNADIKALIKKATPIVQKHLDRAKQIQKSLQPST
jgi:putative membrane protein